MAKEKFTDQEVIQNIRKGNEGRVLPFLYTSISPKVKAYVFKNSGNEDEANDVFQEAFMTFYKYVCNGKFDENYAIGAFIFTISKNLWINYVKKRNRNVPLNDDYTNFQIDESNAEKRLISDEQKRQTLEVFERIGNRCKELLVNIYYKHQSMQDLCQSMGYDNTNAAKTANYKCKQKLIQLIKREPEIESMLRGVN